MNERCIGPLAETCPGCCGDSLPTAKRKVWRGGGNYMTVCPASKRKAAGLTTSPYTENRELPCLYLEHMMSVVQWRTPVLKAVRLGGGKGHTGWLRVRCPRLDGEGGGRSCGKSGGGGGAVALQKEKCQHRKKHISQTNKVKREEIQRDAVEVNRGCAGPSVWQRGMCVVSK